MLQGNDDTLVYSDYMFAATYAIGAHGSVPATAARTVQYRVEIVVEGGRALDGENAPWEIATPATATNAALYIVQYGTTMSATALKNITLESWADASYWESQTDLTYNAEKGCWECLVTVTNACQYLRIGLRAAAGVSVSWKVVSVGVTKVPQGITTAQCAAVSSLGTGIFSYNSIIAQFPEFSMFGLTGLSNDVFKGCLLQSILLPNSLKTITGSLIFHNCSKLTALEVPEGVTKISAHQWLWEATGLRTLIFPSTFTTGNGSYLTATHGSNLSLTVICRAFVPPTLSGSLNYTGNIKTLYVPDDSVDDYKAAQYWSAIASKIKPMSEYTGS